MRRRVLVTCFGIAVCCRLWAAQGSAENRPDPDTDRDGLSDAVEQRLLAQFVPTFLIGQNDCSLRPAAFQQNILPPTVKAEDGTIYGQASPYPASIPGAELVELHYYHLWRTDCGRHGHPLDTEHVAALVRNGGVDGWKALYWYAAAHEDTVCDVSHIARSSTLKAEDHGATVWISPGKHASYLNETLCRRGCGADACEKMTALPPSEVVNLGEPGSPMNGSAFTSSRAWPLEDKMSHSNFPADAIARVDQLPATDIAWFRPGRHPMQGVIARSSSTAEAMAVSGADTAAAISVAGSATSDALSTAQDSTSNAFSRANGHTGNALQKSYRKTRDAIGKSAGAVGRALQVTPKTDESEK